MNDYLKAFLILVVIGAVTWFAFYVFNEYKQSVIMQKKAEAVQGVIGGVKDVIAGRRL